MKIIFRYLEIKKKRSSYPGIKDEALFGSHVGRIGTRVGKTFAAVGALKGLFAAVNPDVLLFQP